MSTTCYISNGAYIRKGLDKTLYELYKGRKPNASHLKVFGSKCFIDNNEKTNLNKFDRKADTGIFELDIQIEVEHIGSLTKELKLLKNIYMFFMRIPTKRNMHQMRMMMMNLQRSLKHQYTSYLIQTQKKLRKMIPLRILIS